MGLFNPVQAPSRLWAEIKNETPQAGTMYYTADIGSGLILIYTGTRWKPLSGAAVLATQPAEITGITNTAQLATRILLPADFLKIGDELRFSYGATKSGTTDTGNISAYIGAAGTTADAQVAGTTGTTMTTTQISTGGFYGVRVVSATTVRKIGTGAAANSSYGGSSTTGGAAATTIPNINTALYASLFGVSSGAVDTLGIHDSKIQLLTA